MIESLLQMAKTDKNAVDYYLFHQPNKFMLNKVADIYEEEVNILVESLLSLLEPIMIVFLGGVIGGIVIALFMPLIGMLEGLSK